MWNYVDWPIRRKLYALILGVALPAVLLVGVLGLVNGRATTSRMAFNQLTSTRVSKARHVEKYFRNVRAEVLALSMGPAVIAAMQGFGATARAIEQQPAAAMPELMDPLLADHYRQQFSPRLASGSAGGAAADAYLPVDATARYLQHHYLAANPHPLGEKEALVTASDGSAYSRVHAQYHRTFREMARLLGFYDLFLVDLETGRVVYSVEKEMDFATRLTTGPHRESGLAAAFEAARAAESGTTVMVDFAAYIPSYGAPAMFVAAPMFLEGERVGVLVTQVPIDEVDDVMTGERRWRGLGESGETYLVGSDRLMRSNSRFWLEDPEHYLERLADIGTDSEVIEAIRRHGTTILQQHVATAAVEDALRGESNTAVIDDYRGIAVLSSYTPLEIEGVDWVLLSEIDAAEAFAPLRRFTRLVVATLVGVTLAIGLYSLFAARFFTRRIDSLMDGARSAGSGDLTARVAIDGRDEFGELGNVFNRMVESIEDKTLIIEERNRQNEELLLNILPGQIASRLKAGENNIADSFSDVSVLFADIVGFTALSETISAEALVGLLNELFTGFDEAARRHGIEKIKTIGDAYMAVSGLPAARDDHATAIAAMAIEMLEIVDRFNATRETPLELRVGINSGPVVAGIIGSSKFIYDLWGDTVNLASRMESHGVPGAIQVSPSTYELLRHVYEFESRGEIEVKGKGRVETWLLLRRSGSEA